MALIGLCLLLVMSTINSLSQGQKLYDTFQQWNNIQTPWNRAYQAPEQIKAHQASLAQIQIALKHQSPAINFKDPLALVQYLENQCQGKALRIMRLPEASQENESGFKIHRTQFSLEGSLAEILKLLYQIEQKDQLGQLSQVQLETHYNRKNGQKHRFLLAHITLEKLLPA